MRLIWFIFNDKWRAKKRALINLTITILCIPFILISETYSGILMVIIGGQILISYFYVLMIKRGVGHDK